MTTGQAEYLGGDGDMSEENDPLLSEQQGGKITAATCRSTHLRRPDQARSTWPCSNVPGRALLSLLVLFLIYVANQADRWLLPVVAPAGMRCHLRASNCSSDSKSSDNTTGSDHCHDDCVDFNDYDQGVLTGPAFCAVYILSGIPLSRLADTKSRTLVLTFGLVGWSCMVFLTGYVRDKWQLYLTRAGLGVGEATCNPVAYSLLSDYFVPRHRSLALAIYSSGVYFGGMLSFVGAAVNRLVCWRWEFRALGILGFAFVPIVLLVLRNPTARDRHDRLMVQTRTRLQSSYTIKETALQLLRCRPFGLICLSASVRNIAGYSIGAWIPTFYKLHYHQSPHHYGTNLGLVFLFGGLGGALFGSILADRMSQKGTHWKTYTIAVAQTIAAPIALLTLLIPNVSASYGLLCLTYFFSETWIGPAAAVVQDISAPAMRCQASAVYVAVSTMVGCSGPVMVSSILSREDLCNPNIRDALLYVIPPTLLLSALLFACTGVLLHFSSWMPIKTSANSDDADLLATRDNINDCDHFDPTTSRRIIESKSEIN